MDLLKDLYKDTLVTTPELVDGSTHTMVKKEFIDYVTGTKFSKGQKEVLDKFCNNQGKCTVKIYGAYNTHLDYLLGNEYIVIGTFERSAKNDKKFNNKRPFFIEVQNKKSAAIELWLIVFPSKEYVEQYSGLVYTYCYLRLREKKMRVGKIKGKLNIKTIHFPALEEKLTDWTGFNEELSNYLMEDDFVVLGHVVELSANLIELGTCEVILDFNYFGLDEIYGISIIRHKITKRRCVLLGFKHSYWGSASGLLCKSLVEKGAKTIMYVAKAGTFVSTDTVYTSVTPTVYTIIEKNNSTSSWEVNKYEGLNNENDFYKLLSEEIKPGGLHLTVPTVIGETYSQSYGYKQFHPATIDNEIGFMAKYMKMVDKPVHFFCIHFITDYLHSQLDKESNNISTYGLASEQYEIKDRERKLKMKIFFKNAAKEVSRLIPVYGLNHDNDYGYLRPANLDNMYKALEDGRITLYPSDSALSFEQTVENINDVEWAKRIVLGNESNFEELSKEKLIELALVFQKYGQLRKANKVWNQASKKWEEASSYSLMLLIIKFKIQIQSGVYNDNVISTGKKIVQLILADNTSKKMLPSIYNRLAICYANNGDYKTALEMIGESKKMGEELPFTKAATELNELCVTFFGSLSNSEDYISRITQIQHDYIQFDENNNNKIASNVIKSIALCLFVEGVMKYKNDPASSAKVFAAANNLQKKSGINSQAEGFAELLHFIRDKDLRSIVKEFMDNSPPGGNLNFYLNLFRVQITNTWNEVDKIQNINTITGFEKLREILN